MANKETAEQEYFSEERVVNKSERHNTVIPIDEIVCSNSYCSTENIPEGLFEWESTKDNHEGQIYNPYTDTWSWL